MHFHTRPLSSTRLSWIVSIFFLCACIGVLGTSPAIAQAPASLVKDINPGSNWGFPIEIVSVNGTVFFRANDGINGNELWKSDGTLAGTVMVKDINPGSNGSDPSGLINFNGIVYFAANDGVHGIELWKSDGTDAGTVMVADINPGSNYSSPDNFAIVNGTLFFRAVDGTFFGGLFCINGGLCTDATAGPVVMVMGGISPTDLTNVNGTLFFAAQDLTHGRELWKWQLQSNGTAITAMVKDINPGVAGGLELFATNHLTNVNGTLFFSADDGVNGRELWKSDGTDAGTVMVKDINPGSNYSGNSSPDSLTNVNGTLFFRANDGSLFGDTELWKSDGTDAGTVRVKDINPGGSSNPGFLTNMNGTLFFSAFDGINGIGLWKSDGTDAGTVMVKDIKPGGDARVRYLTNLNGALVFQAADSAHGLEVWKSDGTAAGTAMVADIIPGSNDSQDGNTTAYVLAGSLVFFSANTPSTGIELWAFPVSALNINHPPTASAQTITTNQDTPVSVVLAGSDPDGDPLTFTITTSPLHGILSGTKPNLTYTPTAGYSGSDNFNFKVTDSNGADSPDATVSITVNHVNYPTTVAGPTSNANPSSFGGAVIFSATVSSTTGTPTGMVTFKDGAATLGTGTLNANGLATYTTSSLAVGSHSITAIYGGDPNFLTSTSGTLSQVVNKANPVITWAPAAINYGVALSGAQLNAAASVPGSFVYSPASGALLNAGGQTLSVTFTPTDTANYNSATVNVSVTVNKAALTISAANASRTYGAANPAFSGTVGATQNSDVITASYATSATTASNAGTYNIVPTPAGAALGNYAVTLVNGTLTVTQASSASTVVSGTNPSIGGASVTFTATATSTAGTPTGSVTFKDGTATLGTGTLNASGVATFSTSSLAVGAHSISAVYGGSTNFTGSTSTALTQTVNSPIAPDFSISANPTSATVRAGQSASFVFTVTPTGGFNSPVTFACSGLPSLATCTFSPATISPNGGPVTSTLTITTAGPNAALRMPAGRQEPAAPMFAFWTGLGSMSLVGIVFVSGTNRGSHKRSALGRVWMIGLFLCLILLAIAGCGGGHMAPPTPQTPQGSSTVTVAATAGATGSTTTHNATVTITVAP